MGLVLIEVWRWQRRYLIWFIIMVLLAAISFLSIYHAVALHREVRAVSGLAAALNNRIIILDAGHGGCDPGLSGCAVSRKRMLPWR